MSLGGVGLRSRRTGSSAGLCTVVVGACLLVASCRGGEHQPVEAQGVEAPSRAAGARSQVADAGSLRGEIEDLLARYDDVVNQIIADPGVARDPEHPLVQEYLNLFEPGSEIARELIDSWVGKSETGLSMHPYSEDAPASLSTLDGAIEAVSADRVRFPACAEQSYVVQDGQGRVTERVPYREQPGEGAAVRVDGEWRLTRLDVLAGTSGCRTEGG